MELIELIKKVRQVTTRHINEIGDLTKETGNVKMLYLYEEILSSEDYCDGREWNEDRLYIGVGRYSWVFYYMKYSGGWYYKKNIISQEQIVEISDRKIEEYINNNPKREELIKMLNEYWYKLKEKFPIDFEIGSGALIVVKDKYSSEDKNEQPKLYYQNIIKIEFLYDAILEDLDMEYDFALYVFSNKVKVENQIPCKIINVSVIPEDKLIYSDNEDILTVFNVIFVEIELDIDISRHSILGKIEEISMLEAKIKSKVIQMLCKEFSNYYLIPYASIKGGYFTIKDKSELPEYLQD